MSKGTIQYLLIFRHFEVCAADLTEDPACIVMLWRKAGEELDSLTAVILGQLLVRLTYVL